MTNITIFHNGADPDDVTVYEGITDTCAFLVEHFGSWPDTAKIYHDEVAQDHHDVTPTNGDEAMVERLQALEGNLFVVIWPEGVELIIAIVAIAIAAAAIVLTFVFRPKTQGQNEGSPNNELSDRQNKARPNERISEIVGTVRSTPDLLALPYKFFIANQEFEYNFGCVSKGSVDVLDCRDDTTPVDDIEGEYVAVYPPFGGPNANGDTPQATFGQPPPSIPPVVTITQCSAVNGQVMRAPNSGSLESNNNIAFKTGGLILTNDPNIDFTQYFQASVLGSPAYLQIFTNDDGVNADDPGGVHGSVGLAGVYQIAAVSSNQITLSTPATVNANWNALAAFTGTQSTYYHTFAINSIGSKWVGPFILTQAGMTEVWANIVGQQGLYYVDNKGRQGPFTKTVMLEVTAVDSTYAPVGDPIIATGNLTGSAINRNIVGITLKCALPSSGPVQVRALLQTDNATDTRNTYVQEIQLRDLFAVSPVQFDLKPPVTSPGTLIAWAKPSTVAFGPDSTPFPGQGYAFADLEGGLIQMLASGPLTNWSFRAVWGGFTLPTDMPSDAVITAIMPVMAAELTSAGPGSPALAQLFCNLNTTPWGIPGITGGLNAPSGGNAQGVFSFPSLTDSIGTTSADLANYSLCARLFQTLPGNSFDSIWDVTKVRFAVYYTSASNGVSAPEVAAFGDFGDVTTYVAVTAQTQDALAIKERKINMLVTRKLPTWINRTDPGPPQFSTTLYPTNNAADIICALAMDPTNGRRPLSQIDVAEIYGIADAAHLGGEHVDGSVATYFGTFLATEFCFTLDDSKVSFEEIMVSITQAINCIAYRSLGSLLGLSFEKKTADSSLLFNHRNKLPKSEQRTVTFGPLNDNDGIEYTYIDPNAINYPGVDTQVVLYFPPDQSAINPKKVTSQGVRNPVQARFNATRMFNKLMFASEQTKFTSTSEASQLLLAERVLVADDTRFDTQAGQIVGMSGLTATTSQKLNFTGGHTYTAFFQLYDATIQAIAVTPGAQPNQMVLAAAPTLGLVTDPKVYAPTTYILVDDGAISTTKRALAFLITDKQPDDNSTFKLQAINYTDAYYTGDTGVIDGTLVPPPAGYGTQGYIGIGLVTPSGGAYVPPARTPFDLATYSSSPLASQNNAVPVPAVPPTFTTSAGEVEVNGVAVTAPTINFNDTAPVAVGTGALVKWQKGGNSDVTTLSAYMSAATATLPGIVPAPPNDIAKFLSGDGTFRKPAITTGTAPFEVDALTAAAIAYIAKGYQGPKLVQSAFNSTGITPNPQALPFNVAAGNTILVFFYLSIMASPAVSDSQGNAYTELVRATGSFGIVGVICFAAVATASGPLTVTASGARPVQSMMVSEYQGVASIVPDVVTPHWHYPPQTTPLTGASIVTTQDDLIVGAYFNDGTVSAMTAPTGMTLQIQDPAFNSATADRTGGAGTYNMNWGFGVSPSNGNIATLTVALKGQPQTGDLFQFFDGYSGVKLSAIDAKGRLVNALTSGAPTAAGQTGAEAYDPATGITWTYNGAAWTTQSFLNPMTTAGDMIVGGAGGAVARLPAGVKGTVIMSNGAGVAPSYQVPVHYEPLTDGYGNLIFATDSLGNPTDIITTPAP